jgi:hypothetical protein
VETSAPVEEVPEESTESVDEDISEPEVIPAVEADQPVQSAPEPVAETVVEASPQESIEHQNDDQQAQAELEIARLNAEVERLRMSMLERLMSLKNWKPHLCLLLSSKISSSALT